MVALFGEINHYIVSLDISYASYSPGSVEYKISLVKRYMLLEILNRFLDISGTLGKACNADIIFKLAVPRVFFPVSLGDIFSCLAIVIVIVQDLL